MEFKITVTTEEGDVVDQISVDSEEVETTVECDSLGHRVAEIIEQGVLARERGNI